MQRVVNIVLDYAKFETWLRKMGREWKAMGRNGKEWKRKKNRFDDRHVQALRKR